MIKAVIFDFDGVIIDSEPLHYEACLEVFASIGIKLSYSLYEKKYLGLSDDEMFPMILEDFGHEELINSETLTTLKAQKVQLYINIIKEKVKLPFIDGLFKLMKKLVESRVKMAICSGSTRSEILAVIDRIDKKISKCFEVITSSEDVTHGKPAPEGYLLTAKKLGVSPENCLVIEDSRFGIQAAIDAKMKVFAFYTNQNMEEFSKLCQIFKDHNEISKIMQPVCLQTGNK